MICYIVCFSEVQGVSKGMVVEDLISTMRGEGKSPVLLLCIGDDRSDEDMFESIALCSNCVSSFIQLLPLGAHSFLSFPFCHRQSSSLQLSSSSMIQAQFILSCWCIAVPITPFPSCRCSMHFSPV